MHMRMFGGSDFFMEMINIVERTIHIVYSRGVPLRAPSTPGSIGVGGWGLCVG